MTTAPSGLYLLNDGTYADPSDCTDKGGVLTHANGVGVATNEDGSPVTIGEITAMNREAVAAAAPDAPPETVEPTSVADEAPKPAKAKGK